MNIKKVPIIDPLTGKKVKQEVTPKYEYYWEKDEYDDKPPKYLVTLKAQIIKIYNSISHPGKKYVKHISICDHLDGVAGKAYKNGFDIAFICMYKGEGGECHSNETSLKTTIIHELGHVEDLNEGYSSSGKYELEEYARMSEPRNEHWKPQYNSWYNTLTPQQKTKIKRFYYVHKVNALKALNKNKNKPHLLVNLKSPAIVSYGKDKYRMRATKKALYILYVVE